MAELLHPGLVLVAAGLALTLLSGRARTALTLLAPAAAVALVLAAPDGVAWRVVGEGRVEPIPIYIDSPLAGKATEVFKRHPECYDEETMKTFFLGG